jgi:short-subunit dehydrogenase
MITEQSCADRGWVLLTGATAGIGYELGKLFAADGYDLVLVARDEERLNKVALELQTRYRVKTRVVAQDLAAPNAANLVYDSLKDLAIDTLINNAGFGSMAAVFEEPSERTSAMMHCNMDALVALTKLFAPAMVKRRRGAILNVASTAAFQPGPFMATYYATKAFVFSYSMALAEELTGTGVYVTTLCPGLTKTEFQQRAQMHQGSRSSPAMSAHSVALAGYRGLLKRQRFVVPGTLNKVLTFLARHAPPALAAKVVRRINGR